MHFRSSVFCSFLIICLAGMGLSEPYEIGTAEAWSCCSPENARTMQNEWNNFIGILSVDQKVEIVSELWKNLASVSALAARYLEAFYIGPLHLYSPNEQVVQRKRGYVSFLSQQEIITQLLTDPEALREHMVHFQTQLKVQKKPKEVKFSPETGWDQITLLFEKVFLE